MLALFTEKARQRRAFLLAWTVVRTKAMAPIGCGTVVQIKDLIP